MLLTIVSSCSRDDADFNVRPVGFYAANLADSEFVWSGPVSREDRIPKLHAARALAYIGDAAVPSLFDAIENEGIHAVSIYDALREIGLPVDDFHDDLLDRQDTTGIRAWWAEHQATSKAKRSRHRLSIGLPALE
jgi:hypothetical protein